MRTSERITGRSRIRNKRSAVVLSFLIFITAATVMTRVTAADPIDRDLRPFSNPNGWAQTVSVTGSIDRNNPFFHPLGTNGRTCVTCHEPNDGWSLTPKDLQARFKATKGRDPVFRTNDGSNSPNLDVSTPAKRRSAYSLLLSRGVIRVGMPVPAGAEFSLVGVNDPYGYADSDHFSLFRRPLPATNLPFLSAVMWDGRETVKPIKGDSAASRQALEADLTNQAVDAVAGHAEGAIRPSDEQLRQIVAFEIELFSAQVRDRKAGPLRGSGGLGGPQTIPLQPFFIGINDPLGQNPTKAPFNQDAFTLYPGWGRLTGPGPHVLARRAVARGETLFDSRKFQITGVGGLNDVVGQAGITGTCTTCHDTPNVGDHSVSAPLNIGTAAYPAPSPLDVHGLPVYTLRCNTTGTVVRTTDPGRALVSGKCSDIGKFKGPILRDLAARAPYFHNGSAAHAQGRRRLLQHALPHQADYPGEIGPCRLSANALRV